MQDFRYAVRALRRQPVFTLAAIATLTIGIAANTAIFSIFYQVLLRPLPYPDADRLLWVWNVYGKAGEERSTVSIPDYLDRKTQAAAIDDATLFTPRFVALTGGAQPEQLRALAVTPSFFSTLRRVPVLGRAFTEGDAVPGADAFAILTDDFWRSHFASDPGVVGRDIQMNGEPRRILGVLPPDFELPQREIAVLVPFSFTPAQRSDLERGNEFSFMIARLRGDATIAQFNEQMAAIVEQTIARVPRRADFMRTTRFGGLAVPLRDRLVGDTRTALYVLQCSVLVVLLIACANVANLLLMRANRRARELAIRRALGAGRVRIVRQLIVEGLALSAAGAVAGLAVGAAAVRGLVVMVADQLPITVNPSLSVSVVLFAVALAVVTGLVFGLAPALSVWRDVAVVSLRDDVTRTTGSRTAGALRGLLVITETALALTLLAGAGLLVKSFARVLLVDPGFSTARVLTAQIALPRARYPDAPAQRAFWGTLLSKLRELPAVTASGVTSAVPFSGTVSAGSYAITNRPVAPGEQPLHAQQDIVGGDYFRALQMPLLEGRVFNNGDGPDQPRVVVVDQMLARRQFPGRSPIGALLNFGSPRNYEIVGVVGTINAVDLALPVPEERIYFSAAQLASTTMGVVLKTSVEPTTVAAQLRAAVQSIDREQPVAEVRTMEQWVGRSLQSRRAPTALLTLFGASALALAAIGIYGVLAFAVSERAREFGIRQALGADRQAILAMVLGQGLRTAGAGIAVGLAGCFAVTRYLQSMLYGVERGDITVLAAVSTLLLVVTVCACYVPARWATRLDPMVALRDS